MNSLEELFLEQLADVYHAETQLTKALPKMAKAATHEDLREAFEMHLQETEEHVTKVEEVFKLLDKPAKGKKCEAMQGLIKEAESMMSENKKSPALNAALIAAAQKVEHYEIASYGTLREWAEMLDNEDAANLLEEILDQEKAADEKLTDLARECYNEEAEGEEGGASGSQRQGSDEESEEGEQASESGGRKRASKAR